MSSLVLSKAFACLVVICWLSWISLTERNRSSFTLVVSCVQVRICFLLSTMSMRVVRGGPNRQGLDPILRSIGLERRWMTFSSRAKRMY
jgi:hypothetical protein